MLRGTEGVSGSFSAEVLLSMSTTKQTLNAETRGAMRVLLTSLEPFRAVYGVMPLQQAYAFLLVAMEEGEGVTEYARRAGVSQSVMTRHLLDLGDFNRRHEPGLGLIVQRPDPLNRRKHQTFLTDKGAALAAQVYRALAGRKNSK